jgi:hypothetical protein
VPRSLVERLRVHPIEASHLGRDRAGHLGVVLHEPPELARQGSAREQRFAIGAGDLGVFRGLGRRQTEEDHRERGEQPQRHDELGP